MELYWSLKLIVDWQKICIFPVDCSIFVGHWQFGGLFCVNINATIELQFKRLDYMPKAPQQGQSLWLCLQLGSKNRFCFHKVRIYTAGFIFFVRKYMLQKTQFAVWIHGSWVIRCLIQRETYLKCNRSIKVRVNWNQFVSTLVLAEGPESSKKRSNLYQLKGPDINRTASCEEINLSNLSNFYRPSPQSQVWLSAMIIWAPIGSSAGR